MCNGFNDPVDSIRVTFTMKRVEIIYVKLLDPGGGGMERFKIYSPRAPEKNAKKFGVGTAAKRWFT
jgi:hypothetical protein